MTSEIQEQKKQRLDILDGISKGLGNYQIASKLGIPLWVVRACAMESKLEDNGGVTLDKRIKLLHKLKIQFQGHVFVGEEQKEGWKTTAPIYMFNCKKHGYVKSNAKGYSKRLECPQCLEELNAKETVALIEPFNSELTSLALVFNE
jgi:hypothetical protein